MENFSRSFLKPRLGGMEQVASVRRLVADDGKGRGMRVVEVNNGTGLSFTVYPDRGMDIGQAWYKGTPLAWLSRNGEVAPQFYDPSGIEWLRTWAGGLLTGCGLANVGGPGVSADGESHGLHGRLSHLPAEEVNTKAGWSEAGTYELCVRGRVRHGRVFGENLALTRRVTAALGDASITVRDTVENLGHAPAPFMLLYHINLGWPLVDAGAFLDMPRHKVVPQNERAAAGLAGWAEITAPVPGFAEQVYYHVLPPGRKGLASARLVNEKLGLAFRVTYRVAELPYLVQWKMMGQGEYVTGLEPANCLPDGREQNARKGHLRTLAPGETAETFLRLSVEDAAGMH
jgi:galactose mutarotase-like enzyme